MKLKTIHWKNDHMKSLHHGIESLNNIELLALVLRTGNKQESAIEFTNVL